MAEMSYGRKRRDWITAFIIAFAIILVSRPVRADSAFATSAGGVGIEQNLGAVIPLYVSFTDETGVAISLARLVHAPTILALVYYQCPNVCDYLLTGLAGTLAALPANAGTDYNVVTISINPAETPADARKAKRIGMETIGKPFPADAWRFLTGSEASIDAVANAVGFHYQKSSGGFDHPVALVILSPTGKIVRYMLGADFLPADMQLSLMEAQKGVVGQTIARIMRICFRVDPTSHKLVFNALRVVGAVTLVGAAALVVFLIIVTRRRRRRTGHAAPG
jgi:protein SCO1